MVAASGINSAEGKVGKKGELMMAKMSTKRELPFVPDETARPFMTALWG